MAHLVGGTGFYGGLTRRQRFSIALGVTGAALLLATLAGCKHTESSPDQKPSLSPQSHELPAVELRDDTQGLLLTWIDEQGDFHVVETPSEIPKDRREAVRVVFPEKEEGTGKLLYVANLNEVTPNGSYRVRTMTRAEWDEIGAGRRKARLEALAPGAAPPPPAPEGAGAAKKALSGIVAIIYGADWCRPCHQAEEYLKRRGVTVVKKDIDNNEAAAKEMHRKLDRVGRGGSSIPVIDIGGQILVGFSPAAMDGALETARNAKQL